MTPEQKKLNHAERILGNLFGFRERYGDDNELVNKATWAFREYINSIRPTLVKKEWLELCKSIGLSDKEP